MRNCLNRVFFQKWGNFKQNLPLFKLVAVVEDESEIRDFLVVVRPDINRQSVILDLLVNQRFDVITKCF